MTTKKSIIFQLDPDLKTKADNKLHAIGMSMSEYLRRCLTSLTEDDYTEQVSNLLKKVVTNSVRNSED